MKQILILTFAIIPLGLALASAGCSNGPQQKAETIKVGELQYRLIAADEAGESEHTRRVKASKHPTTHRPDTARAQMLSGEYLAAGDHRLLPKMKTAESAVDAPARKLPGYQAEKVEVSEHPTPRRFETTRPQILSGEYLAAGDHRFLSKMKPQQGAVDAPARKLLGYRARKDESDKFVFIPVYEDEQEQDEQDE